MKAKDIALGETYGIRRACQICGGPHIIKIEDQNPIWKEGNTAGEYSQGGRGVLVRWWWANGEWSPIKVLGINAIKQAVPNPEHKLKFSARELMYRKAYGIEDSHPDGMGTKMDRFAFLHAYSMRNGSEEAEVYTLQEELRTAGLDPGWPIEKRKT